MSSADTSDYPKKKADLTRLKSYLHELNIKKCINQFKQFEKQLEK